MYRWRLIFCVGRLLERFRLFDDPVDARVQRHPVVDLLLKIRKQRVRLLPDVGFAERVQRLLQAFVVEMHQCHEALLVLIDHRFADVLELVDDGLDLFGIDVLAARAEDHVLGAALDEDETIRIDHAEVPGAQPSILAQDLRGSSPHHGSTPSSPWGPSP